MFILYSLRAGGWLTPSGTYVSSIDKALRVPYDEAIRICRSHFEPLDGSFGVLPVSLDALDKVKTQ